MLSTQSLGARLILTCVALAGLGTEAHAGARQADFNGDGRADLAIGVPRETVGGQLQSGGVAVIYGRASGLDSAGNQFWTAASPGINAPDEGGLFGWSVESGDFDRDGFSDLAIGIVNDTVDGVFGAGGVQIIYGSSAGLTEADDQYWTRASNGVLGDPDDNASFGFSLAAGDFNGDNRDDLAIGVIQQDLNGLNFAGEVHILYGTVGGLTAAGDQIFNQDSPGIDDQPDMNDFFGESLAVGDFNGDSRDDLVIGVNREDGGTGIVHILYGSANGLTTNRAQFLQQGTNGLRGVPESGDSFGYGLASGDFDNDGIADLAIGVFGDDVDGVRAGAVAVLYGTPKGLDTFDDQLWTQNSRRIADSAELNDTFGFWRAAADFDGDGRDDLAASAIGEMVGDQTRAGAVNVLYGTNNGLRAGGNQFWHQNSSGIADLAETEDIFGSAMTAGDYDGDGFDDLVAAVVNEDVNGNLDCGAVNVIYGTAGGLNKAGDQFWHQDSTGIRDSAAPGEAFGQSVR